MKKWEDIIKEKIEEPDGTLPESVFDEFRARRDSAAPGKTPKSLPMRWIGAGAAAAAVIAAFLFLHRQDDTDNGTGRLLQHTATVAEAVGAAGTVAAAEAAVATSAAEVTDATGAADPAAAGAAATSIASNPLQTSPFIAQATTPKAVRQPSVNAHNTAATHPEKGKELTGTDAPAKQEAHEKASDNHKMPEKQQPSDSQKSPDNQNPGKQKASDSQNTPDRQAVAESSQEPYSAHSPYMPKEVKTSPKSVKIASTAGAIAGGGLLAVIAAPARSSDVIDYGALHGTDAPVSGYYTHSFPLRAGLSVGIPVADRWRVTTGLDYSLYQSGITYPISEEKRQNVRYLGIPVRLDRTLASNRWLDIYIGGGVEGVFCLAATLAGESIKKDGFGLDLLGTGGVQFNFTYRLGLYVEPQLSWSIPVEAHVLKTYRREHPLIFSVGTGLRLNLGKGPVTYRTTNSSRSRREDN